jgi:superfamily II DNA or RNA helicase
MTEIIRVTKFNDVHIKLYCDSGIAHELSEYFTFTVPGAKFSPAYKNKMWDGKIRLFHLMRGTLYMGLLDSVHRFAQEREYIVEYDKPNDFAENEFSVATAKKFIEGLELPHEVRDYQLEAFIHAVRKRRALLLSPTASGKSLIIFLLSAFFVKKKVLIVVPTLGLVHQMASDFVSYGCPADMIHKIHAGQDKDTEASFVVTTWQSVYELPKQWFDQFGVVIGDEAHQFKSKSLVGIMEKLLNCKYRFGFTGTLDGSLTNKLVLEGLFGSVKQVTTTAELMESKTVANLKIKSLVLSYEDEARQLFAKSKPTYASEIQYLIDNKARNKFITGLVSSLENNTLLLFNFIDHGKMLESSLREMNPGKDIFIVYGDVEGEEREAIRKYVENNTNVIVVASYKTFSTGVNIQNLHNVVFGSPSKSRVRVLQSVGRGLRKNEFKLDATLYDIADDLSWKSFKNYTIGHFGDRIQMYNQEKFDYKIYTIKLRGTQ